MNLTRVLGWEMIEKCYTLMLLKLFSLLCSGNMSDFNFVVNSLWPDIVEKFELQLPMVFSAGKVY